MATFRSSVDLVLALLCLACTPRESSDAPAPEVAAITKQEIEHVTPRRDFVGPAPTRLEWTAIDGVDSLQHHRHHRDRHRGVSACRRSQHIDRLAEGHQLEPGTYFWRVVGLRGDRVVADSGRAAFVVRE